MTTTPLLLSGRVGELVAVLTTAEIGEAAARRGDQVVQLSGRRTQPVLLLDPVPEVWGLLSGVNRTTRLASPVNIETLRHFRGRRTRRIVRGQLGANLLVTVLEFIPHRPSPPAGFRLDGW